jgi:DNA gyrase subunit A
VVFATTHGNIRRNELSDFQNIHRTGKMAMKFEDGSDERIVDVQLCTEKDDVLLTTRGGKCIRFAVTDVRVFKGRESTGVRGIKLAPRDSGADVVVSLALLAHSDATTAEARAYLKQSAAARRAATGEAIEEPQVDDDGEDGGEEATLSPERYAALGGREQFILAASEEGFGKRTSSYEYRVTGRGGSGIVAMGLTKKNNAICGAFPVEESDDLMLITNTGQTIRCAVADVSVQRRSAGGVTLFRMDENERVVSVERIAETEGENGEAGA